MWWHCPSQLCYCPNDCAQSVSASRVWLHHSRVTSSCPWYPCSIFLFSIDQPCPFGGDVIDHLRVGRTAFYRYFLPERIRELRKQDWMSVLRHVALRTFASKNPTLLGINLSNWSCELSFERLRRRSRSFKSPESLFMCVLVMIYLLNNSLTQLSK